MLNLKILTSSIQLLCFIQTKHLHLAKKRALSFTTVIQLSARIDVRILEDYPLNPQAHPIVQDLVQKNKKL